MPRIASTIIINEASPRNAIVKSQMVRLRNLAISCQANDRLVGGACIGCMECIRSISQRASAFSSCDRECLAINCTLAAATTKLRLAASARVHATPHPRAIVIKKAIAVKASTGVCHINWLWVVNSECSA